MPLPSANSDRGFFQHQADLGEPAAAAGQSLDVALGKAGTARRVRGEVLTPAFDMVLQVAVGLGEANFPRGGEPALVVLLEVALQGAASQAGQSSNLGVGQRLALEPEDQELLLAARVRVAETLKADRGQSVGGERELAHGKDLPR